MKVAAVKRDGQLVIVGILLEPGVGDEASIYTFPEGRLIALPALAVSQRFAYGEGDQVSFVVNLPFVTLDESLAPKAQAEAALTVEQAESAYLDALARKVTDPEPEP